MKTTTLKNLVLISGLVLTFCLVNVSCKQQAKQETNGDQFDRTSLPIKEPVRQTYKELDVRNATAPERFDVTAPKGAPNVIVILIDDMGFGVTDEFGGPVTTPNIDKLADNGLKYNRFHLLQSLSCIAGDENIAYTVFF